MKRLTLFRKAGQARAVDVKENPDQHGDRQVPQHATPKGNIIDGKHPVDPGSRVPKSSNSIYRHLGSRKCSKYEPVTEAWIDYTKPSKYARLDMHTPKQAITKTPTSLNPKQCTIPARSSSKKLGGSLEDEYSPALQSYIKQPSDSHPRRPPLEHSSKSSSSKTSTIFEQSATAPVKIIITSPDEEITPISHLPSSDSNTPNPQLLGTLRELTSTSLQDEATRHCKLDTSRLMPPSDSQVDARKMRKARELQEVRRFLISFINSKGSQFPRALRCKIMETYEIKESELDPVTVSKSSEEGPKDEGVAMEHIMQGIGSEKEIYQKENLKLLELAFQSLRPNLQAMLALTRDIQPSKSRTMSKPQKTQPAPVPSTVREKNKGIPAPSATETRTRQLQSKMNIFPQLPAKAEANPKPQPKQPPQSTPAPKHQAGPNYPPPACLAPLISTPSSPAADEGTQQQELKRMRSAPHLQPEKMFPSHPAVSPLAPAPGKGLGWLRLDERQMCVVGQTKRGTRNGILGAVKGVLSGSGKARQDVGGRW